MRTFFAGLLASLFLATPVLAAQPKLGIVDVQKVMESSPEWVKAVEDMRREFEKRKAKLEGEQEVLKKKKEQLDAKRTLGDPKKVQAEEEALMMEAKKFTQTFMAAQQEVNQAEAMLKDAMLSRIEKVVLQLADEGEYTFVFETGSSNSPNVLYASPTLELTGKVIDAYKKAFGGKAIELPRAQAKKEPAPK